MNGDISMEEMYIYRLRMAFKDFGIELAPKEALAFQAIYAEEQRRISMTPEMERALAQCIQNGAQLGIITNGPSEHQWDKVNALQLTRWIPRRRVIISAEKGIAKPDPRIFVLALESLNQRAEELFFVGDSFMSDVEGAHEAGWKTVWFNRRAHDIPQTATFMPNYTVGTEPQLIALLDEISLA
jgi:putative hydrolase of the HAD superfamily